MDKYQIVTIFILDICILYLAKNYGILGDIRLVCQLICGAILLALDYFELGGTVCGVPFLKFKLLLTFYLFKGD